MIILKQNQIFNIYETDENGLATGSPAFSTRNRYEADAWLADNMPSPSDDNLPNLDDAEDIELPEPIADEVVEEIAVEAQAEKANDKPKSSKSKKS